MFHVKQLFIWLKNKPIHELLFYGYVFVLPFQLRIILNPANAYIGYYFSYHLAIFVYLSDLLYLLFIVSWLLFGKSRKISFWAIIPFYGLFRSVSRGTYRLWAYELLKIIEFWSVIAYLRNYPNLKPKLFIFLLAPELSRP